MKKHIILLGALILASYTYAQQGAVGINTDQPKATLDVVATPTDLTKIDGLIAPRLEGNELKAKDALYTAAQKGTIIYAKSAVSPTTPKTINVTAEGYYYFDGNVWVKVGAGSGSSAALEPWNVQNTSNKAENNTDNIYQNGKVAVGFGNTDVVSTKQFEVKGDMKAEYTNTADNLTSSFETGYPSDGSNISYVGNGKNEAGGFGTQYSVLGNGKNTVMFQTEDTSDATNQKKAVVLASNLTDGGIAGVATATNKDGKYAGVGATTWTDVTEIRIQADQTIGGEDINMEINMRPDRGVRFIHSGEGSTSGYGSYTFPTNTPTAGQVLTGTATTQLEWKNVNDLVKAAMPKFFYMPSVVIPTHNTATGTILTGTQTINLYDAYTQQFQYTGGIGQVRSNASSAIPTLPADELDYFITYYDTDVFENVAVSTSGILTYQVKSTAVVTNKTFMNIVFKVKD